MSLPEPFVVRPTPNPNEFAFVTYVRAQWDVDLPIAGSTLYKDWKSSIYPQSSGDWGGYVYADAVEAPADWLGFLWVKKKTEAEKKKPFREHSEMGNHGWPMVLKSINFLQDPGFPVSTQGPGGAILMAARTYVREVLIPSASEGTLFQIREFLSDTPFKVKQTPVPTPGSVSYDYLGCSGSFGECLHPDLKFPTLRTARVKFTAGVGNNGAFGVTRGQRFPATDFEDWSPYILSSKPSYVEGQWYMIQIKVYPPLEPETIIR